MFSYSGLLGVLSGLLLGVGLAGLALGADPKASGIVCTVLGAAVVILIVHLSGKGDKKE